MDNKEYLNNMQKLMKANNTERRQRKKEVAKLEKRIAYLEGLFIVKLYKFVQRIVRKITGILKRCWPINVIVLTLYKLVYIKEVSTAHLNQFVLLSKKQVKVIYSFFFNSYKHQAHNDKLQPKHVAKLLKYTTGYVMSPPKGGERHDIKFTRR